VLCRCKARLLKTEPGVRAWRSRRTEASEIGNHYRLPALTAGCLPRHQPGVVEDGMGGLSLLPEILGDADYSERCPWVGLDSPPMGVGTKPPGDSTPPGRALTDFPSIVGLGPRGRNSTHPLGGRNSMEYGISDWLPGDKQPLPVRIKNELQTIIEHLGPDAPDPSKEMVPEITRDGVIRFITPTEVYSLAGDFAVRFRPLPDSTKDVTYWRDGVQIRHLIGPPPEE
jgi:hypothetical protein